jgi:mannosyltransferase OCH1-like enzyme
MKQQQQQQQKQQQQQQTRRRPCIPANLFQTWHSQKLPPLMQKAVNKLRSLVPNFRHVIFDDNQCHDFINKWYEKDVLDAYNQLLPGAYKADLWRYCVLYKFGGIYMDIKYVPHKDFKLYNLLFKEHWVLDRDGAAIYNALIVSKPNNPFLKTAIDTIVKNVKEKFYGNNDLEPTGPKLLAKILGLREKVNIQLKHDLVNGDMNQRVIKVAKSNQIILQSYTGYLQECKTANKTEHYSTLWKAKKIYCL